jgi:hypothetical protein
MSEKEKQDATMRDANLAAEQRPVPSQAEGDLETVEQDLIEKDQRKSRDASSGGQK